MKRQRQLFIWENEIAVFYGNNVAVWTVCRQGFSLSTFYISYNHSADSKAVLHTAQQ